MGIPADDIARAFRDAVRHRFAENLATIEHAVRQLAEDDLGWRPHESQNSVRTIILHLCGAIRQWIISGVGGAPDLRDRPREFADRTPVPGEELLARLRDTIAEADGVLAALDRDVILAPRRIQGFETTVLQAVLDTSAHLEGHKQEITYITRLRLGDAYVFRWAPTTIEQGAPA